MLAEKKKFESLQRGIFEMNHNQKEYNDFIKKLNVILEKKRGKNRRKIQAHSYDQYLETEKERREVNVMRKE